MILVTVTFVVGGVTERYVCQKISPPFQLLQVTCINEINQKMFDCFVSLFLLEEFLS